MVMFGGDVAWLLERWWSAQGSTADWWNSFVHISLAMVLNQATGIAFILGSRPGTYPTKVWKPYAFWYRYGVGDVRTEAACDEVYYDCKFCQDKPLTDKVLECAGYPSGMVAGPPAKCMYACSKHGDQRENNDDLERDQSVNQQKAHRRQIIFVSTLCAHLPLRRYRLQHIKRGFKLQYHVTKDAVDKSELKTRKQIMKAKKRAPRGRPTAHGL